VTASPAALQSSLSVRLLLFTNIGAHLLQLTPHRRYRLSACPEGFAGQVALPTTTLPCKGHRAFPFEEADHRGHRVRGWKLDTPLDMIQHHVTFNDAAVLLPSHCVEDRSKSFAHGPKPHLASPFGHKHHLILALPSRMRQALRGIRHGVLLSGGLIKPPGENSTPGSLKAVLVSLVEPVAYLKDRIITCNPCRRFFYRFKNDMISFATSIVYIFFFDLSMANAFLYFK
jgi:hypothetical protein